VLPLCTNKKDFIFVSGLTNRSKFTGLACNEPRCLLRGHPHPTLPHQGGGLYYVTCVRLFARHYARSRFVLEGSPETGIDRASKGRAGCSAHRSQVIDRRRLRPWVKLSAWPLLVTDAPPTLATRRPARDVLEKFAGRLKRWSASMGRLSAWHAEKAKAYGSSIAGNKFQTAVIGLACTFGRMPGR
jgi:hypothetical protein